VKTTGVGGRRGDEGGQPVTGRKRPVLVDTEGVVVRAVVPPAHSRDRDGVKLVLRAGGRPPFPRRRQVWLDAASNGKGQGTDGIEQTRGWRAQIVSHPPRYQKVWVPNDLPPDQIDWSQ